MNTFSKKMKFRIILFSLPLLLIGCKYEHETIPYVNVNFTIYPDDVTYAPLNHTGGYMYFTGGVNGVVVYRVNFENFVAYDRACPYDWTDSDSWICVDESGLILQDSCCSSQFNILDGTVISGPAYLPLKFYRTTYDGRRLRVHN